ncbi:MAG TPA: hypothetical protein VE954_18415 [Oligoflexus sp.]|uniref:hypothetical protein n=1 Tax=Oligoflexus sp. TaxID=1971216 RepID=UPI002D5881A2|nr:hypothetical protein [Oligoflexus sp.]HYX35076.1 hypothetical protein [Oligoflexus sp.]
MKNFIVKSLLLASIVAPAAGALAQDNAQNSLHAVQQASIAILKKKLEALEAQNKDLATRLAKVEGIAADSATKGTNAQTTANDAVARANNAQATANDAVNRANNASSRAASPVVMVGHESGRPWAQCPDGYHWIGGFNFGEPQVNVAYPEVNRWHKSWAWFCAKD